MELICRLKSINDNFIPFVVVMVLVKTTYTLFSCTIKVRF
jgi:hypothetical protein